MGKKKKDAFTKQEKKDALEVVRLLRQLFAVPGPQGPPGPPGPMGMSGLMFERGVGSGPTDQVATARRGLLDALDAQRDHTQSEREQ